MRQSDTTEMRHPPYWFFPPNTKIDLLSIASTEKHNTSLVNNVVRLVLWGWFLICVPVSGARAYYDVPDAPPADLRQGERPVSSPGPVDAFVLYEHIDSTLSGTAEVPPLKHQSKRFVPADMIPVNQPVHMVFRRPVDPANEVANSLYANLKEKRLVEEYADLQRRAQELLAGLSNPAAAPDNRSATAGQSDSIHRVKESLRQKQLAVLSALPAIARGAMAPGNAGTAGAGVPSAAGMNSYRISDTAGAAPGRADGPISGPDAERSIGARNKVASMPWIIEAAFSTFAYLQTNKVEAILYCGLLITIFIGISSLRRR